MSQEKPKLIDKATMAEELTQQYKDLWIGLGNPVIIDTELGFVMFPTSTNRANAWICVYCHETPYYDPLMTKAEIGPAGDYSLDEPDDIPFTMFFTPEGKTDEEMRSMEFHFQCAEKLGIIKKFLPDENGRKEPLTMIEVVKSLISIDGINHTLREIFDVCRSCDD